MPNVVKQIRTLAADGVGLAIQLSEADGLPRVVHWGADPGEVPAAGFGLSALPLLPVQHEGWMGRPAVSGDRAGKWPHLRLSLTEPVAFTDHGLTVRAADATAGVAVECEIVLTPEGVVRQRHTVTNAGPDVWSVAAVRCVLPVPDEAVELLDFAGRWALERVPLRSEFSFGVHARENRRGRTGHDATTVLCLGTRRYGCESGEVWAVHVGWSGNHEHSAERHPDSAGALGGGEVLEPGEIRLAPGESYQTPWVYFVHSTQGLDGVRDRLHRFIRARGTHPRSPRPVVLNTWEAVYFKHDLGKLKALADKAFEIGVERFVLDDGWFRHRRDDTAGLGDWYVDERVWPDGLHPLVNHVHGLGMQFGLWFEPEMINPDSDLYRAHPEWVLAPRPVELFRHQHVLDVSNPDVYAYLLERITALVQEYGIDFIKWDHNRDLVEPASVHRQTLAVYRLLDEIRARFPELEIESCSSGGGRIDLGILDRTDRVWTSDTNDPIDRQRIQLWTGLLLPYELMGSHVGPARTHVTGRVTDLPIRCATALFGHAGIERDLTECSPQELSQLAEWTELYKRKRGLLHRGRVVVPDRDDPSAIVHGVVSRDGRQALFSYAQLDSAPANTPLRDAPMRLRLPGLLPDALYRVAAVLGPQGGGLVPARAELGGASWPGRALRTVGLPMPRLNPGDAIVLELIS